MERFSAAVAAVEAVFFHWFNHVDAEQSLKTAVQEFAAAAGETVTDLHDRVSSLEAGAEGSEAFKQLLADVADLKSFVTEARAEAAAAKQALADHEARAAETAAAEEKWTADAQLVAEKAAADAAAAVVAPSAAPAVPETVASSAPAVAVVAAPAGD